MRRRLGEVLVERQQISPEELTQAIQQQQQLTKRLGEVLLERGLPKTALVEALQEVTRIPYLDAAAVQPDPAALALVPRDLAGKHHALPIGLAGGPPNAVFVGWGFAKIISCSCRRYHRVQTIPCRPYGTRDTFLTPYPALKRRAIFSRRFAAGTMREFQA